MGGGFWVPCKEPKEPKGGEFPSKRTQGTGKLFSGTFKEPSGREISRWEVGRRSHGCPKYSGNYREQVETYKFNHVNHATVVGLLAIFRASVKFASINSVASTKRPLLREKRLQDFPYWWTGG